MAPDGEMMNKVLRSDDEMLDHFSMLPEYVIHHILSLLPFKDIVRSSVLSKTWNGIWSNYPNVDLVLYTEDYVLTRIPLRLDKIERILHQCLFRKNYVHKFQLSITFSILHELEELSPNMDWWLRAAISKNVSELVVKVPRSVEFEDRPALLYSIPEDVFLVGALKVIELQGCMFEDRSTHIELPNLQKFKLDRCQFAGENILNNILRGCPALEFLEVSYAEGVGSSLSVSCKPRLKCFEVGNTEELKTIEISAPSLETFECSFMKSCSIDLASCTALKCLELLCVDNFPIHYLLSKLLCIEELQLHNCELEVDSINISSLRLKRLVLNTGWVRFPGAEIEAPNLNSLDLTVLHDCSLNHRFSSWNVPKVKEIQMHFNNKSFRIICKAGLEDFLKTHNYDDLKLLIFGRNGQRWIIHEKLSAVCFSSLKKLMKKGKAKHISILSSSTVYNYLKLMLGGPRSRLSLVFSSRDSIELLHKRLCDDMSERPWRGVLELVPSEEIEHTHYVWKSFLKTNSIGFHTATIFQRKSLG